MSALWRRPWLGVLVLALTGLALGYETNGVKWPGAVAHLRIDSAGFPAGSAESRALTGAMEDWNAVGGSEFVFTHEHVADAQAEDHGDRRNGVDFSSAVQPSALAVTHWSSSGGLLVGADILFRSSVNWSASGAPAIDEQDLGSTARHELGHALGLDHSQLSCDETVMGAVCGYAGRVRLLQPDDEAGVRSLYPGVSRTPATLPAPRVDWSLSQASLSSTRARPGETVELRFRLQNAGSRSGERPPLRYLLSVNRDLGPQDTQLRDVPTRGQVMNSGSALIFTQPLRIPSGATPGAYFVGVVADPDDADAELSEQNNALALALIIEGSAPPTTPPPTTPPPTTSPPPAGGQVDWVAEDVSVTPAAAAPGATVAIRYRIANRGTATAQGVPEVVIYRSSNRVLTAGDRELTRRPARGGSFPPGASYTDSYDYVVGPDAGTFYVGPHVDPANRAAEADERNNAQGAVLTVSGAGCALSPGGQVAPLAGVVLLCLLAAARLACGVAAPDRVRVGELR